MCSAQHVDRPHDHAGGRPGQDDPCTARPGVGRLRRLGWCAHHVCNVYRYQISTGQTKSVPNTLHRPDPVLPLRHRCRHGVLRPLGRRLGRHVSLVEWVEGQPLNILVEFGPGRDVTSTTQTVPDQITGTDIYFDKYTCRTAASDIYKIVVP